MTTYKEKSSANRAAKKAHGDNWAEVCKVVPVGERFAIELLKLETEAAKVVEELKAGLEILKGSKKTNNVRQLVPVAGGNAKSKVINLAPTAGENRSAGRPISTDQIKVRRRLVEFMRKQNTGQFTVKQATKALKLKRMHVSNAMRWAELSGLVKRLGYETCKRPGRKDVLFTVLALPEPVAEAA